MQIDRRHALQALATALLTTPSLARPRSRQEGPFDEAGAFLAAIDRGDLGYVRACLAEDPGLARIRDGLDRSAFVRAHLAYRLEIADLLRRQGLELDLVESVLAEDWERMTALAQAQAESVDALHPIGGTALYAGALAGQADLWRIRSLGCRPDAAPAGGSGWTPARAALECPGPGARIALTDMLSNGGDVNAPQAGGDSILHAAVRRKDPDLVRLALRKGAQVEARNARGDRAIDLARAAGWSQGTGLLENPDGVPRDYRASRFLRTAAGDAIEFPDLSDVPQKIQSEVTSKSHFDLKGVRELVERDPRLTFSLSTDDELAIEASAHIGQRDLIRFHLDHGAPLSLPTAVSLGEQSVVKELLAADPRLVHERGAHDFPVFWYVVMGGGSVQMAELLLEMGVPVDQESLGATALHWCVVRNTTELASWLIEQGANRDAVAFKWSRNGHTPLQLAREHDNRRLIDLLTG